MATKKYASLDSLQTFLNNSKNIFSSASHKHTLSDITDLAVDSELSPTSTNPVQNKVLDAEFEAISNALTVYDLALNDKADASHTHDIVDINGLQSVLDGKTPASRTINGKALNANIVLSASDVGADASGSADSALLEAKSYADNVGVAIKNDLLNGAGGAYDTLKELGDLIDDNTDAIDALEIIASNKADINHNHNDVYYTKSEIDNLELITIDDIDAICGAYIQVVTASEVAF